MSQSHFWRIRLAFPLKNLSKTVSFTISPSNLLRISSLDPDAFIIPCESFCQVAKMNVIKIIIFFINSFLQQSPSHFSSILHLGQFQRQFFRQKFDHLQPPCFLRNVSLYSAFSRLYIFLDVVSLFL